MQWTQKTSRQAPSPSNTASAGRQQSSAQRSRCPITSMPRSERQPPSFAILIKSRVDVFQLAELPIFVTVLTAPHAPPLSPTATVHRLHQGPHLLCPCSRSLVPRQVVPPFLIVSSQLEAPGSNSLNSWIQPLWLSPRSSSDIIPNGWPGHSLPNQRGLNESHHCEALWGSEIHSQGKGK